MGLKIGTVDISNVMLGTLQVDKIMLGTTEVWSNIPPKPASYNLVVVLTANTSWTVPETKWYKIYCVGRSGDGGYGGADYSAKGNPRSGGGGGAGGNTGGVSIRQVFLKKGEVIPVTISTENTSFGSYASATRGGNGGTATPGVNGGYNNGGIGGVISTTLGAAYGGDIANYAGLKGGAGGKGGGSSSGPPTAGTGVGGNTGGTWASGAYAAHLGGGGGGSGIKYQGLAAYQAAVDLAGGAGSGKGSGGTGTGHIFPAYPQFFCGSGAGGGGAGPKEVSSDDTYGAYFSGGVGGLGSPGGVVIEKGV